VPDVTGLHVAQATSRLRAAGFQVTQRSQSTTDPAEDGVVLEQRPGGGDEIDQGRTIVLVVGKLTKQEENPQTAPLSSPPPAEGTP
jgi:beta-lactam-binding protein with PASTA domain